MGLDNGFHAKGLKNISLPSYVRLPWNTDDEEIAYWRKCWGLRREINAVLHLSPDQYEIRVDKEDIPAILRVIKSYMNPVYWETNCDSIWQWEEYFEHNLQQYINLTYLYEMWDNIPGLEVSWYDSY